jgi:hypothetical protein
MCSKPRTDTTIRSGWVSINQEADAYWGDQPLSTFRKNVS